MFDFIQKVYSHVVINKCAFNASINGAVIVSLKIINLSVSTRNVQELLILRIAR